jgi:hypothetical protein
MFGAGNYRVYFYYFHVWTQVTTGFIIIILMFGAGNYSCLVAKFHLKRSISFHLLQNYLPSILIGIISPIGILLH